VVCVLNVAVHLLLTGGHCASSGAGLATAAAPFQLAIPVLMFSRQDVYTLYIYLHVHSEDTLQHLEAYKSTDLPIALFLAG
jgi:hypothetical protein